MRLAWLMCALPAAGCAGKASTSSAGARAADAALPPAPDAAPTPLSPGAHVVVSAGVEVRYHVAGQGPVCIVQPGGPGLLWTYLRMPEVERQLTLVYVEPAGTGE